MSEYVQSHAMERALSAARRERVAIQAEQDQSAYDRLQNLATHIQVPVWGIAGTVIAWAKFRVAFDVLFPFMPEQQDSPLDYPHFNYGVAVSGLPYPDPGKPDPNNPDSLVAITCHIIDWARDLSIDSVVGAVVGYGVTNGGDITSGQVRFSGSLHLTFSGMGCVYEGDHPSAGTTIATGT